MKSFIISNINDYFRFDKAVLHESSRRILCFTASEISVITAMHGGEMSAAELGYNIGEDEKLIPYFSFWCSYKGGTSASIFYEIRHDIENDCLVLVQPDGGLETGTFSDMLKCVAVGIHDILKERCRICTLK